MPKFKLYRTNGRIEIIEGANISNAIINAGLEKLPILEIENWVKIKEFKKRR